MMAVQQNDQQWLNQIREQVRSAFRGPDVRIPSIMSDWITRESKEMISRPRPQVPEPPEGMNKKDRQEWCRQWLKDHKATEWNRQVSATESRNPGRSKPLIYNFPDGWVLRRVREIHSQSAKHGRMLKHLYAPNQGMQHADWLAWHLLGEYKLDGLNKKTKRLIYDMLRLQLAEMPNPHGWAGIMQSPWEHFGIAYEAWKKYYRNHWAVVRDTLTKLDEGALWKVHE